MAAPVVATHTNNVVSALPMTLTKPAGVVAGDLLVMYITTFDATPDTISGATGFTQRQQVSFAGGHIILLTVLDRVADGSEPSSWSINHSNGSVFMAGGVLRLTGASASPYDSTAGAINSSGTGTSATATGLTTTGPDELVLVLYSNFNGETLSPAFTGMTQEDTFGPGEYAFSKAFPTVGATGNFTGAAWTPSDDWCAITLAYAGVQVTANVGQTLQPPRGHPLRRQHRRRADRLTFTTDALATSASPTDTDTGTGTDAGESIAATVNDVETGTGTESNGSITVQVTDTDSGTGVDAGESISATLTDTDSAAGQDAGESIAATSSDTETATGVDSGEAIAATLSDDDPATATDAGEAIVAVTSISDSDSATATDAGESVAATVTDTETGAGTDGGESVAATLADTDTATATDAGESVQQTAQITDTDTATGTDVGESVAATPADTETATAADAGESLAATLTDDDPATATDAGENVQTIGGTPINDTDTATATDGGESIVVQVTDSDSVTAIDAGESIPGVFPPAAPIGGTFQQYRTRLEPDVLEQLADADELEALLLILALV